MVQSILDQLASSLGKRDEIPNIDLAHKISTSGDKGAVKELVDNLNNKNKAIAHDCIKTLYEVAAKKPEMISDYAIELANQLNSSNNRMVWGAMTALSAIVNEAPKSIYQHLALIIQIADHSGSVIARDHAIYILAGLAKHSEYYADCMALILEQLLKSPINQLPMYAETTAPIVKEDDKKAFRKVLEDRLADVTQDSKIKRIEKVLKKL